MKKRLSLLMVLMMIVSLLPMSAFAASVPGYNTVTVEVTEEGAAAEQINVGYVMNKGATLKDGYLRFTLDNGARLDADSSIAGVAILAGDQTTTATQPVVTKLNSTTFEVELKQGPIVSDGTLRLNLVNLPVRFNNEGDVKLTVNDSGNTGIGSQSVKIATVGIKDDTKLATTVTDAEKAVSFDGGTLSQFEIKNLNGMTSMDLILDDELTWDDVMEDISEGKIVGTRGLTVTPTLINDYTLRLTFSSADDKQTIIVTPVLGGATRKASEGNVKVYMEATVAGKKYANNVVIGKVVDYAVTMTVVEKSKKEIPSLWGGEEATVTVTLKGPKGSILNRAIDFTVDGTDVKTTANSVLLANSKPGSLSASGKNDGGVWKDGEFTVSAPGADQEEVRFDLVIVTDADKDGVATITAAQRGWEVTADLAKVTPKFALETKVTPVKKGEARDTANLVLTEAKAGLLERGDVLRLAFSTKRDYVEFTSKAITVEATNGMTFGDIVWGKAVTGEKIQTSTTTAGTTTYTYENTESNAKYLIDIPVKKASYGDAAVITISGLNVAVDGSTTDDVVKIDTKLNGASVAKADYIKVVKEYDLESITSVFTIGQTTYTVNGEEKTAASAPYIKEGRTMLPIRAVAESLGLAVQWNQATKTASFTDANKVAAVTIGANVIYVNGTPMPLTVPAELTNDTTFVELRSLATAFGVQIDWDAAAKTATVSK